MSALGFVESQLDLQATVEGTDLTFEWVLKTLYDNNKKFQCLLDSSKVTNVEFFKNYKCLPNF